jgi:4-diphosphocytidyl-2-C-methyl-D-erythritol kinase
MIVFPNAKINIGLRILRRRSDGFHDLESIFYPVGLCDMLEILPCDPGLNDRGPGISVSGLEVPDSSENLCLRAAGLFRDRQGTLPVRIHLHKKIPVGAGLGGGSADASFTLLALNRLFDCGLDPASLEGYANELGSDCAFFIRNRPCLARGRGEILEPVSLSLAGQYLLILFPGISIPTSDAYRMVSPSADGPGLDEIPQLPLEQWRERAVNDFEKPAFSEHPELAVLKQGLYASGAAFASMSGSGSAVYGIFTAPPELKPELKGYRAYTGRMT